MVSNKGKDNPAMSAPSEEPEGLLTSEDIFGDMLDAADKAAPAKPRTAAAPAPDAGRKGPIKVKVSEPRAPERSPFTQGAGAPPATEALPEDVAALLDAFSEPGEAATRADLESLVEPPAA